jgi:hypothetical protein
LQAIKNNNTDRLTRQRAPVAHAFDRLEPLSKERYTEKIAAFFDFIGLEGNSLEEKGVLTIENIGRIGVFSTKRSKIYEIHFIQINSLWMLWC